MCRVISSRKDGCGCGYGCGDGYGLVMVVVVIMVMVAVVGGWSYILQANDIGSSSFSEDLTVHDVNKTNGFETSKA